MKKSQSLPNPLSVAVQPSAKEDFFNAVVSWTYENGVPTVLSRVVDDKWCGAKKGSLASATDAMRTIDFTVLPEEIRALAKSCLYAALRHPHRINTPPQFATLIKKSQAVFRYLKHALIARSGGNLELTEALTEEFLLNLAKRTGHIETLVGQISALAEINRFNRLGMLSFQVAFTLSSRGASALAKQLWRKANGKAFDRTPIQPFDDDDSAMIVRSALFYIQTMGHAILAAAAACMDIAQEFPLRRSNRSQEAKCLRAQKKALFQIDWPAADAGFHHWPPKTMLQIKTHIRLLSTSSAISIFFATGCRRTELLELEDACIHIIDGKEHLKINYRKGEEDLEQGRPVSLAACHEVVTAAQIQLEVKKVLLRDDVTDESGGRLFIAINREAEKRSMKARDEKRRLAELQNLYRAKTAVTQRMTVMTLSGMLRDFKKYVTPEVNGACNSHRFRKTVARLVLLTMEGSPLILQTIFGHTSFRTTLGYMFSSPFIVDELNEAYPGLVANNLRDIFGSIDDLGGEGGRRIREGVQQINQRRAQAMTGEDIGMSEDAFVELGSRMVEAGQMTLTVIMPGTFCLKPLNTPGPCANSSSDVLPNPGMCTSACHHNVRTTVARERSNRTRIWLENKLSDSSMYPASRNLYMRRLSAEVATLATWGSA